MSSLSTFFFFFPLVLSSRPLSAQTYLPGTAVRVGLLSYSALLSRRATELARAPASLSLALGCVAEGEGLIRARPAARERRRRPAQPERSSPPAVGTERANADAGWIYRHGDRPGKWCV